MTPRSLYGRLILGALIWTAGLLVASIAIGMFMIRHRIASQLFVHHSMLVVTAAVLVTAGVSVMRRGLSPFGMLRERLAAIREGRATRLEGDYPSEVAPLVEDLNHLLEERERRVARAVARAGDLAHGLKTPLAIMTQDVRRAQAAGQFELAESLGKQVERMRRQIESHLSQARAAAAGVTYGVRTSLPDCIGGLIRTMERLHIERHLTIGSDIPDTAVVRVPLEDLEEILGNLLDNACKWASREIRVSASIGSDLIVVHVDDDGVGLEAGMRESVLQRGVRADEAAPGSGLGLAIVRDLVDTYGGAITLDRSPLGGLRASVTLPAPPTAA
jgi:signal transduction histidine kinase